jgi:hypothetical protein
MNARRSLEGFGVSFALLSAMTVLGGCGSHPMTVGEDYTDEAMKQCTKGHPCADGGTPTAPDATPPPVDAGSPPPVDAGTDSPAPENDMGLGHDAPNSETLAVPPNLPWTTTTQGTKMSGTGSLDSVTDRDCYKLATLTAGKKVSFSLAFVPSQWTWPSGMPAPWSQGATSVGQLYSIGYDLYIYDTPTSSWNLIESSGSGGWSTADNPESANVYLDSSFNQLGDYVACFYNNSRLDSTTPAPGYGPYQGSQIIF